MAEGHLEHVIPQMVVTSADDDEKDSQITTEEYTVASTDVSAEVSCAKNVEKEVTKDISSSAEIVPQQQIKDGHPIEIQSVGIVTPVVDNKPEDTAGHSVAQRPLVIESEKCVTQSSAEPNNQISFDSSVSLPPTSPPTTMQRPLVFESGTSQKDDLSTSQEGNMEYRSQELYPSERSVGLKDPLDADEIDVTEENQSTSMETKPKSSSFSWIPSFPKLHASGKDAKVIDTDASKKDKESFNNQKIQEESSSVKKDGLQNVKKFFDNLLHDTSTDSKEKAKVPNELQDGFENNSKTASKEEKQSYYKKIFSPSKSEKLESATEEKTIPTQIVLQNEAASTGKEPQKDSKYSIKKMFDSFKQDITDKKESSSKNESDILPHEIKSDVPKQTLSELETESTNVSKEHPKDSKYNVKKMLDSFKHDIMDKKDSSSKKVPDISQNEIKSDVAKQTVVPETQVEIASVSKEVTKDSKIKKMFDSFKHDFVDKKDSSFKKEPDVAQCEGTVDGKDSSSKKLPNVLQTEIKSDVSKPTISAESVPESTAVPKEAVKESKIMKMFDSFKHDIMDKKDSSSKKESDICQGEVKSDITKSHSSSKKDLDVAQCEGTVDRKDSSSKKLPKVFQTEIKSDVSKQTISAESLPESTAVPKEAVKESKIKKMFDSFKHDFVDKKDSSSKKESDISQGEVKSGITKSHKDSKPGIKNFLGSLKQDGIGTNEIPSVQVTETTVTPLECSNDPAGDTINFKSSKYDSDSMDPYHKEFALPELTTHPSPSESPVNLSEPCQMIESEKVKPKDGSKSIKKLFSSFKHDGPSTSKEGGAKFHVTFMDRQSSLKRSHSFRDSILIKEPQAVEESEKRPKDNLQSVKNFFMPSKSTDSQDSTKVSGKRKSNIKRSHSCRETAAEKESFHGIKSFFDSFTHKSSSKASSQSPLSEGNQVEEHIYDVVGKPQTSFSVFGSSKGDPKQASSKVLTAKKEDHSSMKKLFDSFRTKDQSPKKSSSPEGPEKEQKTILTPSEMSGISEIQMAVGTEEKKSKLKSEKMESDQQKVKTVPEILTPSSEVSNQTFETVNVPSIQINGPSSTPDTKTSVFNTLSDNFMAIKERVLHPKDSKKSEPIPIDKKSEEYDLQAAIGQKNDFHGGISGTYKRIEDVPSDENLGKVEVIKKEKSSVPNQNEKSTSEITAPTEIQKPPVQELKNPSKVGVKSPSTGPGGPETLYDTCCLRLAVLLGKKAMEIVSDQTKTPPKKPPKPSAEAIAKARAAVVSQRLREIHNKSQSIGESIPVGYDGIRFADEETESSCDYKDMDNFDYIMDYELINRYKCDSKLDTFTDPSTCSGISSYYTADTVTLKDETFSDAPLETVSLTSNDSYLFQHLSSSQNKIEFQTWPSSKKSKDGKENKIKSSTNKTEVTKERKSMMQVEPQLTSTSSKKIPPPIPPKPILSPKYNGSPNKITTSSPEVKSNMSQCINGLSLSPRMQAKFSKESAATKQRPLLVAGFKGTEFTSLQTKHRDIQSKQKERTFNTVLKNESLKNVSTISFSHQPLQISKSSPSQLSDNQTSPTKKPTPQRPPLPKVIPSDDAKLKTKIVAPPVPEKPKRESRTINAQVPEEKRTVSPPRPPPPILNKINVPPPRPPPPVAKVKISDQPVTSFEHSSDQVEIAVEPCSSSHSDSRKDSLSVYHDARESAEMDLESMSSGIRCKIEDYNVTEGLTIDNISIQNEKNIEVYDPSIKDHSSLNFFENKPSKNQSNFCSVVNDVPMSPPKPPPRTRRIRSRTVEIVSKEKIPQSNLRRSQSLSDIDIQSRVSRLDVKEHSEKADLKHLYTSVNKDGKKAILQDSHSPNLEKVSGRPLPAPPPPPRKFRSLDRKPKEKQIKADTDCFKPSESIDQSMKEAGSSNSSVKPPERKRKTDKQRFLSLSTERRKDKSEFGCLLENSKMPRSSSVPLKPERKFKHVTAEFDENANVSFPTVAEVHHGAIALDECGNIIMETSLKSNIPDGDAVDSSRHTDSSENISPHPRQKKGKNPKTKSHSSWYNETNPIEESWEMLDWDPTSDANKDTREKCSPAGKVPRRRQSDPLGSRMRPTSTFYVNIEHGEATLPLLDKETSPLPIDCSEKSVQTSLETLSQGIISRDEQSESSDNTDNLLSIVKTLQSELKVTLNRHKSLDNEDDSSTAATDTEKMEACGKTALKTPSIQSSTSDLWPLSSSDESDGEVSPGGSVNLSEIALKRKKKKIFYIAQEVMTSEEVFVDTLKLLNVDFKAAVEAANKQRNAPVIPDEVLSQIINHLPQLQHLNENLLMELKDRIDNWDKTEKIADIIVKMGPFLKLYSWFIHDFESNLSLLEESKRKYPLFAQVVKEFEASTRCKRLTLNHYLLKPIQRIPQYRLLLQEYLHHLPEESPDYQDTVSALQIVSEVANHANESMKQGDNAQKLISIQNSIMGHKEIIKPGRLFLKEGVLMKLSRKGMQPRWFVLFNDLLLYLTPVQQGLYRINHELPLTGMKVAIPIQQDYQNEFSIISVTRSFTLAARSQEERQEWIVALTKAIDENASKRSTFTNIRLQQKVQDKNSEDDDSDFVLGKKAPVWIPDARVTMCQLCTSEFTVTFRRHHCRACGKVVCSICSGNRIPLPYLGGNKVNRVCDECYTKLGPDAGSLPESGETDSDNQQIAVKPHLRTEPRHIKRGKRNLPSVLKEVCANDQGSTISGYLQKRYGKSWKKAWFVVKDKVLYEYKASEDVAALRSQPLLGYQIESFSEPFENVDSSLLFQLTHPGQAPIIFHADSIGSTERWIAALREASVLE